MTSPYFLPEISLLPEKMYFYPMKSEQKLYWLAQIIGWTTYVLISFMANYLNNSENISLNFLVMALAFALFGILLTHTMRNVMLRKKWLELPFWKLAPKVVLLMLAIAFLLVNVETTIRWILKISPLSDFITQFRSTAFYLNMVGALMLLILWNGIYFTYYFFNKAYFQEMDNLRLQSSQNEIELKNLKSQLNPHFLFNSLNSIRALVEIDPNLAKKTVTQLSNLLRSSLISGKKDTISIGEELAIISDYLSLEKIRFEDRLQITFQVDETLKEIEIPPFIVQTLVENAIKHGVSKEIKGGEIGISVQQHKKELILSVVNTGKLSNTVSETGIGIENTKRRLALMYKNDASFRLYEDNGKVISEISIKQNL